MCDKGTAQLVYVLYTNAKHEISFFVRIEVCFAVEPKLRGILADHLKIAVTVSVHVMRLLCAPEFENALRLHAAEEVRRYSVGLKIAAIHHVFTPI